MNIAVFGLGYVGTVTGAVLAANGHGVWGVDVDPLKVGLVSQGKSPVIEPGLDDLVASGVRAGRLRATTEAIDAVRHADVSLVCVGTPSAPTGSTDLTYLLRAIGDIADSLAALAQCTEPPSAQRSGDGGTLDPRPGSRAASAPPTRHHVVVVRSTVPPGTVDELVAPLLAARLGDVPVTVSTGMCPEFLREGSAIADFADSPLTVVGTGEHEVESAMKAVLSFLDTPVRVVPTRDAEGLKYACNAFHATKVSFANEMGRLFRSLGVDARRVMELLCEDTKLNVSPAYLAPGFAFGGSCLPKDLRSLLYLARMNCIDLPLLAGTMASNGLSISDVVNRVVATDAHRVAILGLSFKGDSDDLRESPHVDLAETLLGKGFDVRIYDPLVDMARLVGTNRQHLAAKLPHVQRVLHPSAAEAVQDADLALVSNAHPSIVEALVTNPPPAVLDLCGRLGRQVETLHSYQGAAW